MVSAARGTVTKGKEGTDIPRGKDFITLENVNHLDSFGRAIFEKITIGN